MEPALPYIFVVRGVPISMQASARSKERWRASVRDAAAAKLAQGHWAWSGRLRVVILSYSIGPTSLDVDNIAKPVLDALTGLLWIDDGQIDELVLRKTDVTELLPSPPRFDEFESALADRSSFVFVHVDWMGNHEDLPV